MSFDADAAELRGLVRARAPLAATGNPDAVRDLSTCKFVLATDLDGTFLGGSERARRVLYDWIEENRETIGLIFVTGRDPRFIGEVCAGGGAPWPDYAVGDVGTSITSVHPLGEPRVRPIPPLEADIAARWGDAGDKVRDALDGAPGLTLQPTAFRYRVSYDMDPRSFDPAVIETVREMGHDHLISDDRYFDVLPKGVSKGPSLRRLLEHLQVDPLSVLCAGDTMNDHSMLASGLKSVAVGGSETALLDALPDSARIHRAAAIGAAGILEAIAAFDLHPTPEGDPHAL